MLLFSFLFATQVADAQVIIGATSGSSFLLGGMVILVFVLLIAAVVFVSDNLLQIEAKRLGVDKGENNYSIFPRFSELFGKKVPDYLSNVKVTHLSKGHDIKLAGEANKVINEDVREKTYSVRPKDFIGMSPIPKILFNEGDRVEAGDILFFDKESLLPHKAFDCCGAHTGTTYA